MSSKSRLEHSLNAFAGELLSFVQRATDSINSLKRTVEQRPQAGVSDFKECLDDLEQQVADFTDEIQQLVQCTADTTSFEELIGHCSAVYYSNRAAALALEQHLCQYGYQAPSNAVLEPQHLNELLLENEDFIDAEAAELSRAYRGRGLAGQLQAHEQQQQWSSKSLPASPVSKSGAWMQAGGGHPPSRLGRSQPGSPAVKTAATSAAQQPAGACLGGPGWSAAPFTAGKAARGVVRENDAWAAADQGPLTHRMQHQQQQQCGSDHQQQHHQQQDHRMSLGSSSTCTPAALMISPGVAALANKYATSSVGGSSVGNDSLPSGQPPSAAETSYASADRPPRRSACRDLNLCYALADTNSPDLPIFGQTAGGAGTAAAAADRTRQQQQLVADAGKQQQQGASCVVQGAQGNTAAAAAAAAAAGAGSSGAEEDDTTGELYRSLIHSNLTVATARDDLQVQLHTPRAAAGQEPTDTPATPPSRRYRSCPASPSAPATAGRLPAEWHSQKMQELEHLQADVTLTLSQMKRAPSASRLAAIKAAIKAAAAGGAAGAGDRVAEASGDRAAEAGDAAGAGSSDNCLSTRLLFGDEDAEEQLQAQDGGGDRAGAAGAAGCGDIQRGYHGGLSKQHQEAPMAAAVQRGQPVLSQQQQQRRAHAGVPAAEDVAGPGVLDSNSHHGCSSTVVAADGSAGVLRQSAAAAEGHEAPAAAASAAVLSHRQTASKKRSKRGAASRPDSAEVELEQLMASLSMKYAVAAEGGSIDSSVDGSTGDVIGDGSSSSSSGQGMTEDALESSRCAAAAAEFTAPQHWSEQQQQQERTAVSGAGAVSLLKRDSSAGNAAAADSSSGEHDLLVLMGSGGLQAAASTTSSTSLPHQDQQQQQQQHDDVDDGRDDSSPSGSPGSPAHTAAGAAGAGFGGGGGAGVGGAYGACVLTPATQRVIRHAVAAGLENTAVRPKSSIRRPQPTTNMQRLQEMRGYWHQQADMHLGLQQQQQQEGEGEGLVEKLEGRLCVVGSADNDDTAAAGGAAGNKAAAGAAADISIRGNRGSNRQQQGQQQQQQQMKGQDDQQHVLRPLQVQQQEQVPAAGSLTPRAARLQRRLQMMASAKSSASGNAAAENTDTQAAACDTLGKAAALAGVEAAAAAAQQHENGQKAGTAVADAGSTVVAAEPVRQEEYSKLPGWCRGLVSLELLNGVLEELTELAVGRSRAGKGSSSSVSHDGFTASDLELLGYTSSKSRTIATCLHKLNRATLQQSATGAAMYKLI